METKEETNVAKDVRKKKERENLPKKLYDKQRYEKMKSDPVSAMILKIKQHEKYLKKKQKGQVKSVSQMNQREKKAARGKWKNWSAAAYRRRKEAASQGNLAHKSSTSEIIIDDTVRSNSSGSSSSPALAIQTTPGKLMMLRRSVTYRQKYEALVHSFLDENQKSNTQISSKKILNPATTSASNSEYSEKLASPLIAETNDPEIKKRLLFHQVTNGVKQNAINLHIRTAKQKIADINGEDETKCEEVISSRDQRTKNCTLKKHAASSQNSPTGSLEEQSICFNSYSRNFDEDQSQEMVDEDEAKNTPEIMASMDEAVTSGNEDGRKTNPRILQLISAVKTHEVLWRVKEELPASTYDQAWEDVANQTGLKIAQAKAQWKAMRDSFYRILRIQSTAVISNKIVENATGFYTGKWPYFEVMSFLAPGITSSSEFGIDSTPSQDSEDLNHRPFETIVVSQSGQDPEQKHGNEDFDPLSIAIKEESISSSDCACIVADSPAEADSRTDAPSKSRKRVNAQLTDDSEDDDMNFFKSLVPYMKKMSDVRKLAVRNEFQNIIIRELSKED
uniref:Transcription factor Adf-1 n=1 Tax=Lygus hesperus TaxID=30085 RepID=A0A0A9XT15_LYGHE